MQNSSISIENFSLQNSVIQSPQTFKIEHENVNSDKDAKVIVFLVNHKQAYIENIQNYLKEYQENHWTLLVEDPDELEEWKRLGYNTVHCWENKDILDKVNKKGEIFIKLAKIISQLETSLYTNEIKQKAINNLLINIKIADKSFDQDNSYQSKLLNFIKNPEVYKKEIEIEKKQLLEKLGYIFKIFVCQQRKNFPIRQQSLINCVNLHLTDEKVVVICGYSHGNTKDSKFSQNALDFIHLLEKTTFRMYNLEGVYKIRSADLYAKIV